MMIFLFSQELVLHTMTSYPCPEGNTPLKNKYVVLSITEKEFFFNDKQEMITGCVQTLEGGF